MNDQTPVPDLPELSTESITRIEDAVFAEIAQPTSSATAATARARVRRRRLLTGLGVAAAFAAGILVAPPIMGVVSDSGVSMSSSDSGGGSGVMDSERAPGMTSESVDSAADESPSREVIQTAQATLKVVDIRDAADEIAALADENGGYVESTDLQTTPVEDKKSAQAPPDAGHGWISIRIPSDDLTEVVEALASSGQVLASSISKHDVTSTAIDLRARVDASRASVQRLTELMSNTGSVSELIEAETALADRQAELESYEQQLAALDDQVAMSTLQVELTRTAGATTADPAGFGDGLIAGWNGLIVSLNALVIAFGFLLPWLAVAGVIVLLVWLVRRRRSGQEKSETP